MLFSLALLLGGYLCQASKVTSYCVANALTSNCRLGFFRGATKKLESGQEGRALLLGLYFARSL